MNIRQLSPEFPAGRFGHESLDRGSLCGGRALGRPISRTADSRADCCSSIRTGRRRRSNCATTWTIVPIESKFLLSQHFSAIAAAGPIVGPILAGVISAGCRRCCGFSSARYSSAACTTWRRSPRRFATRPDSIAEVVRDHMSRRSYFLFLMFIWIALVYIIVAFTDITASAFVGGPEALR